MSNLFESINVSNTEADALGQFTYITYDDYANSQTNDIISDAMEEIGISSDDPEFFDAMDVIQNKLQSSYEGETVYIWLD